MFYSTSTCAVIVFSSPFPVRVCVSCVYDRLMSFSNLIGTLSLIGAQSTLLDYSSAVFESLSMSIVSNLHKDTYNPPTSSNDNELEYTTKDSFATLNSLHHTMATVNVTTIMPATLMMPNLLNDLSTSFNNYLTVSRFNVNNCTDNDILYLNHQFDDKLYDYLNIPNLNSCINKCESYKECGLYSYNFQDKTCILFKRSMSNYSRINASQWISGPQTCCSESNLTFLPDTLVGQPLLEIHSKLECEIQCHSNDECVWWAYNADLLQCQLHTESPIPMKGMNSESIGNRGCRLLQQSTCMSQDSTFLFLTRSSVLIEATQLKESDGADFFFERIHNIPSATVCQVHCERSSRCLKFVHQMKSQLCILLSNEGNITTFVDPEDSFTIGPRSCCGDSDTIYSAQDITVISPVSSATACKATCQITPECRYYTFLEGSCSLKASQGIAEILKGAQSGPSACNSLEEALIAASFKKKASKESNTALSTLFVRSLRGMASKVDISAKSNSSSLSFHFDQSESSLSAYDLCRHHQSDIFTCLQGIDMSVNELVRVCGSDGEVYLSQCHLNQAKECAIRYNGPEKMQTLQARTEGECSSILWNDEDTVGSFGSAASNNSTGISESIYPEALIIMAVDETRNQLASANQVSSSETNEEEGMEPGFKSDNSFSKAFLFVIVICFGVFCGVFTIGMLLSKIFLKEQNKKERVMLLTIMSVCMQSFDFCTDLSFTFLLFSLSFRVLTSTSSDRDNLIDYKISKEQVDSISILFIVAVSHLSFCFLLNATMLIRFWKKFILGNLWSQAVRFSPFFASSMLFSCFGLRFFTILDSGLAGLEVFSLELKDFPNCQDTHRDLVLHNELFLWSLVEDIPQLGLQIAFNVVGHGTVTPISLLSMISTIISILSSIFSTILLRSKCLDRFKDGMIAPSTLGAQKLHKSSEEGSPFNELYNQTAASPRIIHVGQPQLTYSSFHNSNNDAYNINNSLRPGSFKDENTRAASYNCSSKSGSKSGYNESFDNSLRVTAPYIDPIESNFYSNGDNAANTHRHAVSSVYGKQDIHISPALRSNHAFTAISPYDIYPTDSGRTAICRSAGRKSSLSSRKCGERRLSLDGTELKVTFSEDVDCDEFRNATTKNRV